MGSQTGRPYIACHLGAVVYLDVYRTVNCIDGIVVRTKCTEPLQNAVYSRAVICGIHHYLICVHNRIDASIIFKIDIASVYIARRNNRPRNRCASERRRRDAVNLSVLISALVYVGSLTVYV